MAGAKPGVHVVQLKPISVPESLIKGNKFIKWDDDSPVGIPVTLKVDKNGYILYWRDQHKDGKPGETDCLDILLIRDTRTGKYARTPKDQKLRDITMMGSTDVPLEDKMITVVYSTDMVNVNYINFAATSKEVAVEWTDELFKYATNLLRQNSSPTSFLEKAHTKLVHVVGPDNKIPVKNIMKMFAAHKDDRKRIEKALEASHLPAGRNDFIHPNKFTFEDFLRFYRHLCGRTEVENIFRDLGAKKKPYLTAEQFCEFLNNEQRDPRLNEILYPFYDVKRAQDIIDRFETNRNLVNKSSDVPPGQLSQEGFLRYLMSEENALIAEDKFDLSEDMDQPLSHYFINSSHNTYLTGHQLTGKSSVEIYRQALLTGCRCVELDCWDGKGAEEEPIITHGFTMCSEISFREVIEAIGESAFKVSDYPVILSFENHCSPKQQAKMAAHCRNILGEAVLADFLETHPLDQGVGLPSPAQLRRKIIIKNKKRHVHKSKKQAKLAADGTKAEGEDEGLGEEMKTEGVDGMMQPDAAELSSSDSELESEDEDDEDKNKEGGLKDDKGTAGQEAEAGMEMSALVNYVQPVHFHSFEVADKRNRSYECSSFVETHATALLKENPVEFVNYNKRQISRIYPKGTRVDSSNYMPQIFWNAGCQLVALNFQTLDLAMMLNLGIFEYNGRSGYILKPDFMRRKDRTFDPFAESTVDGIIAGTVEFRVLSAQFLTDKRVGAYVEVDMYGLPADTVRKRFRTKTVPNNGISPVWDEAPFIFKKVVLPNLATLRIAVCEENGKLLGHRVLPVEGLRPGYRHIGLRNELNQPQNLATLFVHIKVKDYVPDAFADFAAALANPIAYQSALEKHSEQLAVLEEDFDAPQTKEIKPLPAKAKSKMLMRLGASSTNSSFSRDSIDEEPAETRAAPAKKDEGISRTRNQSLVSKKSGGDSAQTLSRVGSVNTPSEKAESTVPPLPQGSGPGSVPPMSRMQSSVSTAVAENGLIAANSRLNGPTVAASAPKSTSLPGSPLHAISSENGPSKPEKIDVAQTTRLKDPDVVEQATLSALKEQKQYTKLAQKLEKEVEALRKKQDKTLALRQPPLSDDEDMEGPPQSRLRVQDFLCGFRSSRRARNSMQELHGLQEEKLLLSQVKSKGSVEKTQRKSVKRASKYGSTSEVDKKNQDEMTNLISEQTRKHRDLKRQQSEAIMELCKSQCKAELDVNMKYHPQMNDLLATLVTQSRESQLKTLDSIHDKEVTDLKKKLDAQNREEMKSLAKKHKDKNELQRIKREAQQKHINLAVQERQKLRDILEKRKEEVERRHDEIKKQVEEERKTRKEELQQEYERKCERLEEECRSKTAEVVDKAPAATSPLPSPSVPDKPSEQGTTPDGASSSVSAISPTKPEAQSQISEDKPSQPAPVVKEEPEEQPPQPEPALTTVASGDGETESVETTQPQEAEEKDSQSDAQQQMTKTESKEIEVEIKMEEASPDAPVAATSPDVSTSQTEPKTSEGESSVDNEVLVTKME